MALEVQITDADAVQVVACRGRIVFGEETTLLCKTVRDLFAQTPAVVLDLGRVENADSGGLGALVGLVLSARRTGGDLKFCNLTPRMRQLLRVTRLDSVFDIYPDALSAVRAFLGHAAVA